MMQQHAAALQLSHGAWIQQPPPLLHALPAEHRFVSAAGDHPGSGYPLLGGSIQRDWPPAARASGCGEGPALVGVVWLVGLVSRLVEHLPARQCITAFLPRDLATGCRCPHAAQPPDWRGKGRPECCCCLPALAATLHRTPSLPAAQPADGMGHSRAALAVACIRWRLLGSAHHPANHCPGGEPAERLYGRGGGWEGSGAAVGAPLHRLSGARPRGFNRPCCACLDAQRTSYTMRCRCRCHWAAPERRAAVCSSR